MRCSDRRKDLETAQRIYEGIKICRAFGVFIALKFFKKNGIVDYEAVKLLDGKYDRRLRVRRIVKNDKLMQ